MAYIGRWNAIVQMNNKQLSGRAAWIMWRGAYLTKSISWRNRILIPCTGECLPNRASRS